MTLQRIGGRIISSPTGKISKIPQICRGRRLNVCEANFTLNEVKQHDRSVQNAMIFINNGRIISSPTNEF